MTTHHLEDRIVHHLSVTDWDDLTADSIHAAKRCIVDTLGVTLAGSSGEDVPRLVKWLETKKQPGSCSVFVYGSRLPATDAAWANGAMARAREFDDSHDATGDHPSVPVFAAAIAAAQDSPPVNGREFLTAYVLATDMVARLRVAPSRKVGATAFAANTYATLAAAIAAARIFKLRGRGMYDAISWAVAQAGGSVQLQQGGNSALHIHHGLAVAAGVQAAHIAREGLPGMERCLTGRFGFYEAYENGAYDPDVITDKLGERFETSSISVKQYPSGRVTHGPIESALHLRKSISFTADDIVAVDVTYTQGGYTMTCEPAESRKIPTTPQHAKFSLYYNVACALARGHVDLSDFTHQAVNDPTVRDLAAKIRVRIQPITGGVIPPGDVTVHLRNGQQITKRVDSLLGSTTNPVDLAACARKARACASHAAQPVDLERLDNLINMIDLLEEVDDVGQLFATLC